MLVYNKYLLVIKHAMNIKVIISTFYLEPE